MYAYNDKYEWTAVVGSVYRYTDTRYASTNNFTCTNGEGKEMQVCSWEVGM
jgi:hypothetical protein